MNLLCCPFVAALQMFCPWELTILRTFAVWSSAVTNKRYFRKVFSSVDRTSDCRMKSSVGSHGKIFWFLKGFSSHVSQVQSNMLHYVGWAKFICKCHSMVNAHVRIVHNVQFKLPSTPCFHSDLHYPIISRLTKKHWIQIILFWNVQYSISNQENSWTMKVCNNQSMSLRVKTRILLFLDLGVGNLNPVLWQPDTSQHHKIRLRINPKPYCDILK